MSDQFLSLLIESLVAVLLVLTIGYCLVLNQRLKRLRADESSLRATIAELVTATTVAERAIDGLRTTVSQCDATLGERLRTAERISSDLTRDVQRGEEVISRIHRIASAAKPSQGPALDPLKPEIKTKSAPSAHDFLQVDAPRVSNAAAAAQAIAVRARLRSGEAA